MKYCVFSVFKFLVQMSIIPYTFLHTLKKHIYSHACMPSPNTAGCTMLLGIDLVKGSGLSQVHISVCLFWAAYVRLHTGVLMDMSG